MQYAILQYTMPHKKSSRYFLIACDSSFAIATNFSYLKAFNPRSIKLICVCFNSTRAAMITIHENKPLLYKQETAAYTAVSLMHILRTKMQIYTFSIDAIPVP